MNGAGAVHHLPLYGLMAAILVMGLIGALFARHVFSDRKRESPASNGPDWSVPVLDSHADLRSFFHAWDPRIKVVALFVYCFLVVSLHSIAWSLAAFIVSAIAAAASRIPWRRPVRRLLAMSGFLSMFLLALPFTVPPLPGGTILIFDPLLSFPFHVHGFLLALAIVLKACAIALMMEPLLGTAPLAVTLQALAKLGVPSSMGQMLLLCHRYIFVFLSEIKRMHRGMRVRGFRRRTDLETMRAYGNFLGMLFVRSFARTQSVHDAMTSRGYTGAFPTFATFQTTKKDWAKGVLWITIGILLLICDRLAGTY